MWWNLFVIESKMVVRTHKKIVYEIFKLFKWAIKLVGSSCKILSDIDVINSFLLDTLKKNVKNTYFKS